MSTAAVSSRVRFTLRAPPEPAGPREALEQFAPVRDGEVADGALRGAGFAQAALGDHNRRSPLLFAQVHQHAGQRVAQLSGHLRVVGKVHHHPRAPGGRRRGHGRPASGLLCPLRGR